MTQEEKARAYDAAIERAKIWRNNSGMPVDRKGILDDIFPELQKSEYENIRKWLIGYFNQKKIDGIVEFAGGLKVDNILSWLEKQGEKQQKTLTWKHWKDGIAGNGEGKLIYLTKRGHVYSLSSCLGFECDYIELSELDKLLSEKQGEQKVSYSTLVKTGNGGINALVTRELPNNICDNEQKTFNYEDVDIQQKDFTPKVEPKFKVGDWCIDNEDGTIFQIVKVLDNTYTYKTNRGKEYSCTHYSLENDARVWAIQDAKDGDVLVTVDDERPFIYKGCLDSNHPDSPVAYCGLDTEGYFCRGGEKFNHWWTDVKVQPATKEQCDLLFKKMKEEAYEWDAEKKELTKIVDKSSWSEEDEMRYTNLIFLVKCSTENDATKEGFIKFINKLKSLRPQNTWKPSDEQMKALEHFVRSIGESGYASPYDNNTKLIYSLLEELKKLKDE